MAKTITQGKIVASKPPKKTTPEVVKAVTAAAPTSISQEKINKALAHVAIAQPWAKTIWINVAGEFFLQSRPGCKRVTVVDVDLEDDDLEETPEIPEVSPVETDPEVVPPVIKKDNLEF